MASGGNVYDRGAEKKVKLSLMQPQIRGTLPDEMPESASNIALAILDEKKWELALDFLSMIGSRLPSPHVFNKIISHIMLEQKGTSASEMVNEYVRDLVKLFSPCANNKDYYFDTLFPSKMERNIYEHIHKLFKCCLEGGCSNDVNLKAEKTCDKNCLLVLKFIAHVLTTEHQQQIMKSMNSEMKVGKSFICRIFWTLREPDSISGNCKQLISIINSLFKRDDVTEDDVMFEVLKIAQNFLCMLVESVLYSSHPPYTEVEAIYYSSIKTLQEMRHEICCNCPNIFSSQYKLELFLQTVCPTSFKILLCSSILSQLVKGRWTCPQNLSLRYVIFTYMFEKPELTNEEIQWITKRDKCQQRFPVKCKKKKKLVRILTHPNLKTIEETRTLAHKACIDDRVNMLDDVLDDSRQNCNAKDYYGRTPLHYACEANNYLCAKIFLQCMKKIFSEDLTFQKEIFVADCNGQTPLHICTEQDSIEMTKLILRFEGDASLSAIDKNGCTPVHHIKSDEMRSLLEKRITSFDEPKSILQSDDFVCEQRSMPIICKTSTECVIQLSCLHTLLTEYVNFFHLQEFNYKENPLKIAMEDMVQKHFLKKCKHVAKMDEVIQLCDDLCVIKNFPSLLKEFEYSIRKSTVYNGDVNDALTHLKWFANCL